MRVSFSVVAIAGLFASCPVWAEPVKITNIGHGYYSAALYVAKAEKLFEKHGLEPDITFVQGGALAFQSVATNQADVTVVSYEHILTAAVQGKRVVAFYNIANRPVNNVTVSADLAKGAKNLSLEEKVMRLKGKRVAMPSANGSGEKMLKMLAKKYKLELPGDISTVYLGSEPASYVAAFQRGLIDAAVAVEPVGVMLKQAGSGDLFINVMNGEVSEFADILFMVLATNPDTIRDKPELLRKVTRVFQEAVTLLKTNPNRGKELLAKEYPALSAEANSEVYETLNQIWPANGRMTDQQALAAVAIVEPVGPVALDIKVTYTNAFVP